MNTILRTFLLAFSVYAGGCLAPDQIQEYSAAEKAPVETVQIPEYLARVEEPLVMVQVRSLTLAKDTLALDYRVSNHWGDDIWVCIDTRIEGKQDVQHATTRIRGETAWIRLRSDVERNRATFYSHPIAKYLRLGPDESYEGKILLPLPLRDHFRERQARRRERKETTLHRAVFEVGYFGPERNEYFDATSEMIKKEAIKPVLRTMGSDYYLTFNPYVTEETFDGKLREVVYIETLGASEMNEQSSEVLLSDVEIPSWRTRYE